MRNNEGTENDVNINVTCHMMTICDNNHDIRFMNVSLRIIHCQPICDNQFLFWILIYIKYE